MHPYVFPSLSSRSRDGTEGGLSFFALAGLLTRSVFDAFPSALGEQWHDEFKNILRAHSSGNCSGF